MSSVKCQIIDKCQLSHFSVFVKCLLYRDDC
nr:MAG TPA: hypothetical protein [Caudoviricetes sp.]